MAFLKLNYNDFPHRVNSSCILLLCHTFINLTVLWAFKYFKLLAIIELRKVEACKAKTQNLFNFYTQNNELREMEINKTIPFIISSERAK